MRTVLSLFVLTIVYAVPMVGVYQFAEHGSGIGACICVLSMLVMSVVVSKALGDE